jgi:hypothetical protein
MLDLSVTISAILAREGHDNDLLKEGDARNAHLGVTLAAASVAAGLELHHLFLYITFFTGLVLLI